MAKSINDTNFKPSLKSWGTTTKNGKLRAQELIIFALTAYVDSNGSAGKLDQILVQASASATKGTCTKFVEYIVDHTNLKFGSVGKAGVDGKYKKGFSIRDKNADKLTMPRVAWFDYEREPKVAKAHDILAELQQFAKRIIKEQGSDEGVTSIKQSQVILAGIKALENTVAPKPEAVKVKKAA